MQRTNQYLQHSSTIWPIWLEGWVFVYELKGCGFMSSCSHWNFVVLCFEPKCANTLKAKDTTGGKMC